MAINWNMSARLFIKAVLSAQESDKPDFESDLRTCVEIAKAWPDGVVYKLHVDEPIQGKNIRERADVEALPSPN